MMLHVVPEDIIPTMKYYSESPMMWQGFFGRKMTKWEKILMGCNYFAIQSTLIWKKIKKQTSFWWTKMFYHAQV